MTPWISVQESVARDAEGNYLLTFDIVDGGGVPRALFVYSLDDNEYSHVAVVDDIESWPESRESARDGAMRFYRTPSVTLTAATQRHMRDLRDFVKLRLDEVVKSWEPTEELEIPGTRTYTIGDEG